MDTCISISGCPTSGWAERIPYNRTETGSRVSLTEQAIAITMPINKSKPAINSRPSGEDMLRIRLRRVGKKGHPAYRIVVAEASAPRDGAYVEWIGQYDPMKDPPAVTLKADRAIAWLQKGAQPSAAVQRILERDGIMDQVNA